MLYVTIDEIRNAGSMKLHHVINELLTAVDPKVAEEILTDAGVKFE